ncbi:hypothetical protein EU538_00605 [Candidatus Thorarchaeota archaeon]|nr:MAG: hypothetical protein EU538_00605 [Candidatus Thorarchaeota archaeon]
MDGTPEMRYEFFSLKGFVVGAVIIAALLILQSLISFPTIWLNEPLRFGAFILISAFIVGFASGAVLVYLIPPNQDVIGLAGLGSDDLPQSISLSLVILALIQPMFSGFIFFYSYFGSDPLIPIWILAAFAAPSAGFAAAMFERQKRIADDLRTYFQENSRLNMVSLDWLHGLGPRTATYRMGMLESAASRVENIRVVGHEIVREGSVAKQETVET